MYLCGMHSNKNKRQILPKDQNIANRKVLTYKNHMICVKEAAKANLSKKISGSVQCCKMQMMKEVLLMDGCLNVFPNNKHQNRTDGFGCASLSPMRLGPVNHRQPNLNICKNIENYHQMNKVWPCEVNENNDPLPIFYSRRTKGYDDEKPHRHKFDAKELANQRKQVNGKNKNAPLYSVHETLDGEERRFTYVQSRYFYCKAYEYLAKKTQDFVTLQNYIKQGYNLVICGYDAYPITQSLYECYCDETKAFGHELALYVLLTVDDASKYPWNVYREQHLDVYDGIAHVDQ